MTYATFFTPRGLALMFATGADSKPTPDGGPWVCEYSAPPFADPHDCAARAERLLWRAVMRAAPEAYHAAVDAGWVAQVSGVAKEGK